MTTPIVTDPEPNGYGFDVTVSDGQHTHRVWVPLRDGDDEWMYELAVEKWRGLVAKRAQAAAQAAAQQHGAAP